jgi:hypothetical protein
MMQPTAARQELVLRTCFQASTAPPAAAAQQLVLVFMLFCWHVVQQRPLHLVHQLEELVIKLHKGHLRKHMQQRATAGAVQSLRHNTDSNQQPTSF